MKDLILVESPTKARTLNRFLDGKYDIEASMGHVMDLPKSNLGVDIEHDFKPQYEIPEKKEKVVASLRKKVKEATRVILATDPDREGEAISHHLYEILKKSAKKGTEFKRIVFHEITKEAIDEALAHPGKINEDLVSAQTARRVLDRIVGYKLSPLLWKKVKVGLSAGRVQSVALRLIVERQREIEKFKKEPYFRVYVILASEARPESQSKQKDPGQARMTKGLPTEFELIEIDGKGVESATKIKLYDGEYTYKKTIFQDQKKVEELLKILHGKTYLVTDVSLKETKRSPAPPFITSSLQQEAARRFGFSGKKTMMIAQRLYEHGFISYHRTDSFNLSQQFIASARAFVKKEFGDKYLFSAPRLYVTKSKVAQEAHEAIRPTKVIPLNEIKQSVIKVAPDAFKIYDLIYRRAVATQMSDAIFESSTVTVSSDVILERSDRILSEGDPIGRNTPSRMTGNEVYTFRTNGLVMLFDGFLKVWPYTGEERLLPEFEKDEILKLIEAKFTNHETSAPPRYNEASIIGRLEDHGIGRPSTYASIISTIFDRDYIEKIEGRFQPTPIGNSASDFLVKNFPEVDDIPFTAEMEEDLDTIANGEKQWVPVLKKFYTPFAKGLKAAEKSERVEIETEKTDKKCPKCGSPVVVRYGRFGKFYSCSTFPDCDYTAPFVEETGYICPEDQGKIVARKTRKGRVFYGCINYPKCKFAVWKLDDLKKSQPQKDPSVKTT